MTLTRQMSSQSQCQCQKPSPGGKRRVSYATAQDPESCTDGIVAMDEHPDMDEDDAQLGQETSETLPPLVPSTNPLFPNAVVKKGSNTHPKTAMPKPSSTPKQPAPTSHAKSLHGQERSGKLEPNSVTRLSAHSPTDYPTWPFDTGFGPPQSGSCRLAQDDDMGEATNGEAPGADVDHDQVIVVSDRMDED